VSVRKAANGVKVLSFMVVMRVAIIHLFQEMKKETSVEGM